MDIPEINKTTDDRHPYFRSHPTLSEALNHARALGGICVEEERAERLLILNHHIEGLIGQLAYIYADYTLGVNPNGLNRFDYDNPSTPYRGLFRGFVDIDTATGTELAEQQIAAKLHNGNASFTTPYTKVVYENNMFFPVNDVDSIESTEEIKRLFNPPRQKADTLSDSDVFGELEKHISRAQTALVGSRMIDPRISDGIEPWDYRDDVKYRIDDFRNCSVNVVAEHVIVVTDNEVDKARHTKIREISFSGYYMGIVGFQGTKGNFKPHFAFEIYGCTEYPQFSLHSERVSPIVLIPISDEVDFTMSK